MKFILSPYKLESIKSSVFFICRWKRSLLYNRVKCGQWIWFPFLLSTYRFDCGINWAFLARGNHHQHETVSMEKRLNIDLHCFEYVSWEGSWKDVRSCGGTSPSNARQKGIVEKSRKSGRLIKEFFEELLKKLYIYIYIYINATPYYIHHKHIPGIICQYRFARTILTDL